MNKRTKRHSQGMLTYKNAKKNKIVHQQNLSIVEFCNKPMELKFVNLCKGNIAKSFTEKSFAKSGMFCYY